jgi:hypothetical protein
VAARRVPQPETHVATRSQQRSQLGVAAIVAAILGHGVDDDSVREAPQVQGLAAKRVRRNLRKEIGDEGITARYGWDYDRPSTPRQGFDV